MTIVLAFLFASQSTVPAAVLDVAEERLILEAVLHDARTIRLFGDRRVQVTAETALPPIHDVLGGWADGLRIRMYEIDQVIQVPEALLAAARNRNRRPLSMRGIRRPPQQKRDANVDPRTETWGRITVSRPGLSADGLSAIVAVTRSDFALAGYTVYLEKRGGVWRVVGEGGQWVV